MSVTLSLLGGAGWQFFTNTGAVLTGGKLYTYAAGTTTPLATYTTVSGNVAHTNPIVLDAAGRVSGGGEIWLTLGVGYKFVVKTADDVLIATYDNIPSAAQAPAANDANSIMYEQGYTVTAGSFVIGNTYRILSVGNTDFMAIGATSNTVGLHFVATGVGSGTGTAELSQTVEAKLRQTINVKDFGAVGNGIADDSAFIQAACDAANTIGVSVFVPSGTYKLTSKITVYHGLIGAGSDETFFQGVNAGVKSGNLMEFNGPGTYQGFTIDGAVSADPPSWNSSNYNSFTGWNNIYFGASDIVCVDIFSRNSAQAGFGAWQKERCLFINCRTQRTRNSFGDGFFAYLCKDFTYINCRAYDYTRIGFVFDGDGTTLIADRASYINCYAEYGHDSSILYGGGELNAGFWAENHDNARYENCSSINNTYSGYTIASASGNARTGYFGNCFASKTPVAYNLGAFASPQKLSIVLDACSYDADGTTPSDIYTIGNNTFAILNGCSAKLDGGGSQTRVIGLSTNARVDVNQFNEYWTNKPLANLYSTSSSVASVGGFPGSGIVPDSFKVDSYKTLTTLEPCVIKWIGSPCGGGLLAANGVYDIPRFYTDGGVNISGATINSGGTNAEIAGAMNTVSIRNCNIANTISIGWEDNLNQAVFDSCNFTRSTSGPNINFYRNSGTTYKPSRLKLLNSTFSSDLASYDYYIQQNADPAVFNNIGQNILVTGCVFYNTGGATANFAIRQEATSGAASRAYVGSSWKSSTITNVATYLNAGAVINDL